MCGIRITWDNLPSRAEIASTSVPFYAYRIAGINTTAPAFKERDSSGRYVWSFEVACTEVREL